MDLIHKEVRFEDEETFSQELEEIKRYSLGNQLRTGFFGQDVSVQTDVSELPLVKRLSDETAELVKEMETLKKEIAVKVKFIEAQYESRLQEEAEAFYTRMNCKVKALESYYKEKITVLRNSCQQQLADAIEVVKASYKVYMKEGEMTEVAPGDTGRVRELLNELQDKDFKIKSLSEQLRECEERAQLEISPEPADDPEKDRLRTENGKLQDDVDILHFEMEQIRQALQAKNQSLKDLALNMSQLKSKAEDDKKSLQKLAIENDQLKAQLNHEKESEKKQRLAAEKRYEEERLAEQERQRERELLAQEAMLNTPKAQGAAVPVVPVLNDKDLDSNTKELAEEAEKLKKANKSQKQYIGRLEKQISMINQAWEKKFEILRQSFHAIKDEMYLRQSLQRQAATLHQASVSYTMGAPASHKGQKQEEASFKKTCFSTKTPLPSIGASEMQRMTCKTVDIQLPSEQTDAFSSAVAETQLVNEGDSDEESTEILPLLPASNRPTPSLTELYTQNTINEITQ